MAKPRGALPIDSGVEQSLDAIMCERAGEWLLIGVTRHNQRDEPTHGVLMAHHGRESVVCRAAVRVGQSPSLRYASIAILHAAPRTALGTPDEARE